MNVLVLTNLFPSRREPTRGMFNLYGFNALASLCNVHVVVPVPFWRRIQHREHWRRQTPERYGNVTATYPTYWSVPRIGSGLHATALYRSVRGHVADLHRTGRFDAVLGAFAYPDAVAAARLAKDLNLPLVAFVLGSDINVLAQQPSLRGQIRSALAQASSVIAVSHGLKERVIELGIPADRVVVQHNGVDGERFRIQDKEDSRRAVGFARPGALLCFVGNLVREKGPDLLVEALGLLKTAGDQSASVAFIGDGDQKQELAARASALGLGGRAMFLGRLPPEQVALWISASDALCLPSRREGCPNVVLESLASGRPVIAAAVGGVPELLSDRNGVMVTPDDAASLAAGIHAALAREWDPKDLRATVPSLSWSDLGRVLHDALRGRVEELPSS